MNPNKKILIVDDDIVACETLASLIRSDHYDIQIATSGKIAIELALKSVPDIVLLDVMMPEMDGFEVCRFMRENPTLKNTPIIMVTALDDRESKLRGIETGADDYITKPFDRLELRLRVKTIAKLNRCQCILEEKEKLEQLFQISPYGIVIINQKGFIELYNHQFYRLLGIKSNHLADTVFESYIHPDHQDSFKLALLKWEENPAFSHHLETLLLNANGYFLPVELIIGIFSKGEDKKFQITIRDLSQEKNIKFELNLLRKALARSHAIFMIMDLDWKFIYINAQAVTTSGYSEEEILGKDFSFYFPHELNHQFHNITTQLRRKNKDWKGELICQSKTGDMVKNTASISSLSDNDGNITHYVIITESSVCL